MYTIPGKMTVEEATDSANKAHNPYAASDARRSLMMQLESDYRRYLETPSTALANNIRAAVDSVIGSGVSFKSRFGEFSADERKAAQVMLGNMNLAFRVNHDAQVAAGGGAAAAESTSPEIDR